MRDGRAGVQCVSQAARDDDILVVAIPLCRCLIGEVLVVLTGLDQGVVGYVPVSLPVIPHDLRRNVLIDGDVFGTGGNVDRRDFDPACQRLFVYVQDRILGDRKSIHTIKRDPVEVTVVDRVPFDQHVVVDHAGVVDVLAVTASPDGLGEIPVGHVKEVVADGDVVAAAAIGALIWIMSR